MTPSRQEIDHPASSSSSSTSPTKTSTVSSDSMTRQARRDLCGMDSYPVTVSSKHVERQVWRDLCSSGTPEEDLLTKPTKNPKPNMNEDPDLERRDLLSSDIREWLQELRENLVDEWFPEERRDLLSSDIPEWLHEFRENLVGEWVPEHRDSHVRSSHEPSVEPTPARSADLGKHSVKNSHPWRPKLRDLSED